MKKFTYQDLDAYLKSYFEASEKDKVADEKMETQDVKTGDEERSGDFSAPLIYSNIIKALRKNEIADKKIIHIIQDIAEANGDDISEDLAKKMVEK